MKRILPAILIALIACFAVGAHATGVAPTVRTSGGPVQGVITGAVAEFLGIPYAAPPVGDLRWRPPQPPQPWTAPRVVNQFGNSCPQPDRGVFATPSTTEDCLYLNIFAPKAASGRRDRRPVMVWFLGGGLFSGESNDYDGSKLAAQGDVIVVTFNYRLGALGFISLPTLNGEGHPFANYGIMDQQFALEWVKRNIATFGGDPNNVTIFGQSSGGGSVVANLVSPLSAGLFERAIIQSGSSRLTPLPPDAARKASENFAAAVGCANQVPACLRAVPVEKILASQGPTTLLWVLDFPMVDGTVIPRTALDAFKTGQFNHVPIINGVVRDEQAFFMPETNTGKPLSSDEYENYLSSFGPANEATLKARYSLSQYPSPSLAEIEVAEKQRVCATRRVDQMWARYVPVYAYEFADRTAPSYLLPLSYPTKAYHSSDVQYLFPLFHGGRGTPHPLAPAQSRLSDRMVTLWTHFALTGAPSTQWARYSVAHDDVMILDLQKPKMIKNFSAGSDCGIWDPINGF